MFPEKYLSYYILLTDQVSFFDCLYFVRYWSISVLQLCCLLTRLWRHEFWSYKVNNQVVFPTCPKTWISLERKELLIWNEKHFSSFLRGFNEANNTNFLEGESPALSNFEHRKPWKNNQLSGVRPDPSCFLKNKCRL